MLPSAHCTTWHVLSVFTYWTHSPRLGSFSFFLFLFSNKRTLTHLCLLTRTHTQVKNLTDLCDAARDEVAKLRASQQRIEQQDKFLAGFVNTALGSGDKPQPAPGFPPPPAPLASDLGKVSEVFSFFEQKATYIDGSRRQLQVRQSLANNAGHCCPPLANTQHGMSMFVQGFDYLCPWLAAVVLHTLSLL